MDVPGRNCLPLPVVFFPWLTHMQAQQTLGRLSGSVLLWAGCSLCAGETSPDLPGEHCPLSSIRKAPTYYFCHPLDSCISGRRETKVWSGSCSNTCSDHMCKVAKIWAICTLLASVVPVGAASPCLPHQEWIGNVCRCLSFSNLSLV